MAESRLSHWPNGIDQNATESSSRRRLGNRRRKSDVTYFAAAEAGRPCCRILRLPVAESSTLQFIHVDCPALD